MFTLSAFYRTFAYLDVLFIDNAVNAFSTYKRINEKYPDVSCVCCPFRQTLKLTTPELEALMKNSKDLAREYNSLCTSAAHPWVRRLEHNDISVNHTQG